MLKRLARGRRGLSVQGRMRPDIVVIISPGRKPSPSVCEARKYFLGQQLAAQSAIERLDDRVLRRRAAGGGGVTCRKGEGKKPKGDPLFVINTSQL